jgi:methionine-rich copper-binding protein CopC
MRTFWLPALLIVWASIAVAHSPVKSTSPSDGSVLTTSPEAIEFVFKRNFRLTRVEWGSKNGALEKLDIGEQTEFSKNFSLPIETLESGNYVIEWRGLGDDGHAQKGRFTFSVD